MRIPSQVTYTDLVDNFTQLEPLKVGEFVTLIRGQHRQYLKNCKVESVEETGKVTLWVPAEADPEDEGEGDEAGALWIELVHDFGVHL